MKILIDARLYGLENAGLGRYVMNLVDKLSKVDNKNSYILLLRKKYFDSINLPKNWRKVLADFGHYSFSEQIKLPFIINSVKPDITHFLHFNIPLFGAGKYIVTIHDILMHKNRGLSATTLPPITYLVKRLAYKLAFKNAVTKAREIIVPSNAVKKELVSYYQLSDEKVKVVYEGFDERISNSGNINFPKPYFVYAGNAYPHKNLEKLVEAIVTLNKNSNKNVYLAISSSRNIFTKRLEKVIKKNNAATYVKLLGFVPDDKLGRLYRNSEAFIFPSLSEGFGLPGLEAMKVGTLVAASNIEVFREVYKNNVSYFDPNDTLSIVTAMKSILAMNKTKRKEIIEKGIRFSSNYSWIKMASETLEIYKSSK